MDEKKLPLTSHLQELRTRLILSFVAIGVGFGLCYTFSQPLSISLLLPF